MALAQTINTLTKMYPASKNRVALLLDQLEGTEDHAILLSALANRSIRNVVLTAALQQEYPDAQIDDKCVGDWKRKNLARVDGL